jgi:hypothetical protein
MYKVRLQYIIFSEERSNPRLAMAPYSRAARETELPFPPFVSLHLELAHDRAARSIVKVTWRSGDNGQYFVCDLDDVYSGPAYDNLSTYGSLKDEATAMGWSVQEFQT